MHEWIICFHIFFFDGFSILLDAFLDEKNKNTKTFPCPYSQRSTHTQDRSKPSPDGLSMSTGVRPVKSSRRTMPKLNTSDLVVNCPVKAYLRKKKDMAKNQLLLCKVSLTKQRMK